MSLATRINVGVSARSRSAVCTPLCAFKVVSKPTSKTTKTAKTSFTTKQTKTKQRSVPATEATVSPTQYLGLTGFSAVAGTAFTFAPQTFWELLGSRDIVDVTIQSSEVYGVYWLLVATAAYRLSQAADSGNLSSATYQRLNAFLALFSVGSALPLLQGAIPGDLSPAPAAAVAAVLASTAATTYIPAYLNNGGSTDVPGIAAGFGDALKTTFKAGRGWTGVFYSLNFWESFILGVALVGGPILPTVEGDISGTTLLVKNMVGVGTILYSGLIWLLLDADDRGRLGASTFRALNGACGLVSLLVGAVCVLGQANGVSTNLTNQAVVLVSCALTAGVYGYQATRSFEDSE